MKDDFITDTIDDRVQDNQPQERRAIPRAKRKRRKVKGRTGVDRRRVTPHRLPEPADETPNVPAASEPDKLELWDRETVLAFFGGSKPIHVSTLYRGVNSGIYPPPMNVSANVVRWIGHECRAARQRMMGERGKTPKPPRGRPRRKFIA